MGAIARNIANNITTAGVFTPSALNASSVTGITVLANASDGITLISSQTASNSASISFTTGINSTYKAYKFVFINIHARTDSADFKFNLSTDGGSNYNVNKTTNAFYCYQEESGAGTGLSYVTDQDLAQSTGDQFLLDNVGSGSDENGSFSLTLFNPSSTTFVKHFITSTISNHATDYCVNLNVGGYANTTSAVNAIIFRMDSGNFDGTIYMYGIK
jgi:hypothetical protein